MKWIYSQNRQHDRETDYKHDREEFLGRPFRFDKLLVQKKILCMKGL